MMHRNQPQGFTLIEVLIALAIIGIAMTAVIKAASQHIYATSYLQKKTIALWVGQDIMNQTRAHLLNIGNTTGNQKLTTNMLGEDWDWKREVEDSPNPRIKKVAVKVYESNRENASPVITLEGYVTHEDRGSVTDKS